MPLCVALPVTARELIPEAIRPSFLIAATSPSIMLFLCLHCNRLATRRPTPPLIPSKGSSLESLGEVFSPSSFVFHSIGSHPEPRRKSLVSSLLFKLTFLKEIRLKGPLTTGSLGPI